MRKVFLLTFILLFAIFNLAYAGVTGKIAGRVTDKETGDPLPGVNITIEKTTMGAASDINGYFTILNIPPGTYVLQASMVGYTKVKITDVVVVIDQTTPLDFEMSMEVLDMEEVVVVAERPLVQKDVSASQMNVVGKTILSLPIQDVDNVVQLQAGIREGTNGFIIRGSGAYQTAFMIDGLSLNDERANNPYTDVSLSSIKELKIQTGGFNAEYGNLRSGLINVITKEGSKEGYSGVITYIHRPPNPKNFGPSVYDPNTFFTRPYMDPEVCWTGTQNGAWDSYTQQQYPIFEGWNAVSEATMQDSDPNNDLTPQGAKRLWEWQHRRRGDIVKPDYDFDAGIGGPVPFIGDKLGNLRFFASHKREQEMFVFPLSRDSYDANSTQIKLVSDISSSMKLTLTEMYGENHSVSPYDWTTTPTGWMMRSPVDVARRISGTSGKNILYVPAYYSPSSVYRNILALKFTHVLSPNTFYEVKVQQNRNKYNTFKVADRDTSRIYEPVNGYFVDEAPWGYRGFGQPGIGDNIILGGWMNLGRDNSLINTTKFNFDFTSQINFRNQIKTGLELVYNDYRIRSYTENPGMTTWNREQFYNQFPFRIGAYIQDKLEFEGFIANIGLRADYTDPNGEKYALDPYDEFFKEGYGNLIEEVAPTKQVEGKLYLSPRLGVSHPITENSKLYFNYGHMYQEAGSSYRFRLQREYNGLVTSIGNPNLEMEKTVAYELGYTHNLWDLFLLNVAAYYKDITNQPNWVYYQNINNSVKYNISESNNYEDIRGLELTLTKSFGRWVSGFINYTYEVITYGYFGLTRYYQDPNEQRKYLRQNPYQERPHPQPYARLNIDFHTPQKYGPEMGGFYPLEAWNLNVLAEWREGRYETYNPNNIPGLVDDVQWKDFHNVDLRIGKNLKIKWLDVQLYMDITNVFNVKYMAAGLLSYRNYTGFSDNIDYQNYLESLHFSWEEGEQKGDDRLGEYGKDYIDMPNLTHLTFLNPRDFKFGVKISF